MTGPRTGGVTGPFGSSTFGIAGFAAPLPEVL